MKHPNIKELYSLVRDYKKAIDDDCRAYEDSEKPGILLTVGADGKGKWGFQSGDTSFSGGAYGFPFWGQVEINRGSNCRQLARDLFNEILDEKAAME